MREIKLAQLCNIVGIQPIARQQDCSSSKRVKVLEHFSGITVHVRCALNAE